MADPPIIRLDPLDVLRARLALMGKALDVLCLLWILVVGIISLGDMSADDLAHHRAPAVQEKIKSCEGRYAARFDCTDVILQDGHRVGMENLGLRVLAIFLFPALAQIIWRWVMTRASRLK